MRSLISCAVLCLLLFANVGWAVVPLQSPEELKKQAQHVVTARVKNVFTGKSVSGRDMVDRTFAIEVEVNDVAKGGEIAVGSTIFVKTWQLEKRPDGWAGPSGQSLIPKRGEKVTIYLSGNKGSYEALLPNGIAADK